MGNAPWRPLSGRTPHSSTPSLLASPACSACGADLSSLAPSLLVHPPPARAEHGKPDALGARSLVPGLTSLVAAALHPPAPAPAEVHATNNLHTGDLHDTPWLRIRVNKSPFI
jgi:hypothetical protein